MILSAKPPRPRLRWASTFCLIAIELLPLTAVLSPASAATYYIDPLDGNDTHTGTAPTLDGDQTGPWRTLCKAVAAAANGSTIYLKGGNYGEVTLNGIASTRTSWSDALVIKPYAGQEPTFVSIDVRSMQTAYLEFNDLDIECTAGQAGIFAFRVRDSSHVRVYDVNATGWWPAQDTTPTTCGFDLDQYTQGISDILVQGCRATRFSFGIEIHNSAGASRNVVIRDNHIYNTNSSMICLWGLPANEPNAIIVEYNHCNGELLWKTGGAHASGISCRMANCTIRGNIVRNFGGSGAIRTYGSRSNNAYVFGHTNMLIENNVVFNSGALVNCMILTSLDHNTVVRNNTVISTWRTSPPTPSQDRYTGYFSASLYPESAGNNIQICNNVVLGRMAFTEELAAVVHEDYNLVYSFMVGGKYSTNVGPHSRIACIGYNNYTFPFTASYLETPKAFFEGSSTFVDDFLRPDGDTDKVAALRLAPGSIGIDAADTSNAPLYDLARARRDARPDIGCYEYVSPDPNYHPPVFSPIEPQLAVEQVPLSFSVNASDPNNCRLTCSVQNLPVDANFVAKGSSWEFSWTPSAGQARAEPYEVTFIVSDGKNQDSEKVAITVLVAGTNRPPTITRIGDQPVIKDTPLDFAIVKGTPLTFSVTATDADGDTPVYSATGLPTGATFSGNTFDWTPGYDQVGTYQVTFTASDDNGGQDSETVQITVKDINRAPVLNTIGAKSVDAGATLSFSVSATDEDGDPLTYLPPSPLPTGATFSVSTKTFSWTPSSGQKGSYSIAFSVSDGLEQDSESVTITVTSTDHTAPKAVLSTPTAGSIQVPVNTLVTVHVTDSGDGVDAGSVTISVDGQTAYAGNVADYAGPMGHCRRSGTPADYQYTLQPDAPLGLEQTIEVTVSARDLAGNTLAPVSWSFVTEMRSFGRNVRVGSTPTNLDKGRPSTATDSLGRVWVAWHAGSAGSRDVYVARYDPATDVLGEAVLLTTNAADQCNPAVAVSDNDRVYVVWQDNTRGNWDLCGTLSVDGTTWSGVARVTDSNDNEVSPAIAVDHLGTHRVYVAWQDDRAGNDDVYVAFTDNGFVSQTFTQVTNNTAAQTDPAIAIGADNAVYLVWTDTRGGSADLYGASSANGFGSNVPFVNASGNQTDPGLAVEPTGSVLHLVWVDDRGGDTDIYYASTDGMPSSPLEGVNLIDDTSSANQSCPAIRTAMTEGDDLGIYACWLDARVVGTSTDTDLYFADLGAGCSRTNVLVGDGQTNSAQSEPVMGIQPDGHPFVVWTDGRNTQAEVYMASDVYVNAEPLRSTLVLASEGGTVGTPPAQVAGAKDVSVVVPPGALASDLEISISDLENTPSASLEYVAAYDFGPSGTEFREPVTVTIPYTLANGGAEPVPYWYDPMTETLSQEGITDIRRVAVSGDLRVLTFKTTHFTLYFAAQGVTYAEGGSGGGGGCSVAPAADGQAMEFLIPYMGLGLAMTVLRLRDRRRLRRTV